MSTIQANNNLMAAVQARLTSLAPQQKLAQANPSELSFEDKFNDFASDLDFATKLKGATPYQQPYPGYGSPYGSSGPPMGYFGSPMGCQPGVAVGPRDLAPADSGDVEVPGVTSLKQTANGCTLQMVSGGFSSLPVHVTTYVVDSQKGTVEVTEERAGRTENMFGMEFKDTQPQRESYTLDLNTRTVENYVSEQGWNLAS